MLNNELQIEISRQILSSIHTIEKRIKPIKASEDFLKNERNLERLDSICMQLIALGESIKTWIKYPINCCSKNIQNLNGRKQWQ